MSIVGRVFGPSRSEIWRKLSEELYGEHVKGGFGSGEKVVVEHLDWTLTLDTYTVSTGKSSVTYTRMRAPFVNPLGFRFTVYRKSVFTGVAKLLGMQDIEIGDPPFDSDFVIKATDVFHVRALLGNARIRELIARQPQINLSVKDDEGWFATRFPSGVDELHFVAQGVIKDLDRLKLLYELFAETLEELCRIGAVSNEPPNVKLK
jgi:hypothetical protein